VVGPADGTGAVISSEESTTSQLVNIITDLALWEGVMQRKTGHFWQK
jgi:hypothetical protein